MHTNTLTTQNHIRVLKELAFEMKLLLVEDDTDLLEQLTTFFLRFFNHVDTAHNGKEALEHYHQGSYDLVITDLSMPVMDGIALCEHIRLIHPLQHIIVISAHSESDKLIELINIGVDSFILKPVNIDRLVQRIVTSSQAIYDHKMLNYFNTLLEQSNAELRASNLELEKTLNELYQYREAQKLPSQTISESGTLSDATDFYLQNDPVELERTNEDLEQIEDDFNLVFMGLDRNTIANNIITFNQLLRLYSSHIHRIPQCHDLGYALILLSQQIETSNVRQLENMEHLIPMITTLFDYLEQWRRKVFMEKNIETLHFMDELLFQKISEIETELTPYHEH